MVIEWLLSNQAIQQALVASMVLLGLVCALSLGLRCVRYVLQAYAWASSAGKGGCQEEKRVGI